MNDLNFNNEFSYKENKSNLFISFNRQHLFFIFIIIAFIFSSKIIYLGAQQKILQLKIYLNLILGHQF